MGKSQGAWHFSGDSQSAEPQYPSAVCFGFVVVSATDVVVFGTVVCIGVFSGSSVIGIVVSKPAVVGAADVVAGSGEVASSSHVGPVYCSEHVQVNVIPSSLFEHVPEFLHGDASHGFGLSVVSGVVV